MVAIDTCAGLTWLAEQGARFALPRGRTKGQDANGYSTLPTGWQDMPNDLDKAIAHAKDGGNVGLLTGTHSGGIITIDVDRLYPAVLESLGPYAKTVRVERTNAPNRGKLLYKVGFPVESQSWKPEGWKPEPGETNSPWSELLSDGRHALIPPSEYDGGAYVLANQEYGIATLTDDDLALVWYKATEGRSGLPEPIAAPLHTETSRDSIQASVEAVVAEEKGKAMVLDAWSTLAVFEHHGMAGKVAKEKKSGETRLLGNGGLLIKANGEGWYDFADNTGGGDSISAWGYCKRRTLPLRGKDFWDVLREMADAKGLILPTAEGSNTNGAALTPDDIDRLVASGLIEPITPGESDPQVFKRLTLADLMNMPPKEWLIDQILGPGDLGMVYGAPGSGKTFAVIDMVLSSCLGKSFAGRFDVARPLTVAYAAGEGGSGLAQRFQAAAEYHGVIDGNLPGMIYFSNVPQLYDGKDPANAAQFVLEYATAQAAGEVAPLDLLVLDTLHSVTAGADENSSQHMGIVLRMAKAVIDRLGCALILVHHSNKNGTAERGSSALRGAMDCMVELKGGPVEYHMSCEKLKDGERWQPQSFVLVAKADSVRVEWGPIGPTGSDSRQQALDKERLCDVMVQHAGVKFTTKSLAEAIGKSDNHARNLLSQMERAGDCVRELSDPTKSQSSRNPWLYSVSQFASNTG